MSDFAESGLTYEEPASASCGCCAPADYAPIAEPVVAEPVVAEPVVPEPVAPEPVAPEPVVAEPVVAEPVAPEPVVAEPVVAEPAVSQSPVQQGAIVEPSAPAPETIVTIGDETPGVTSPIDVYSPAEAPTQPQGQDFTVPGYSPFGSVTVTPAGPLPQGESNPNVAPVSGPGLEGPTVPPADLREFGLGPGVVHNGPPGVAPLMVPLTDPTRNPIRDIITANTSDS